MSNDASGIQDELTITLTKGQPDEVSVDVEPSNEVPVSDGLISVDENVLAHLLNYHNTCKSCNLNEILNRRAE